MEMSIFYVQITFGLDLNSTTQLDQKFCVRDNEAPL